MYKRPSYDIKTSGVFTFKTKDKEYLLKSYHFERENDTEDGLEIQDELRSEIGGINIKNSAWNKLAKGQTITAKASKGNVVGKLTRIDDINNSDKYEVGGEMGKFAYGSTEKLKAELANNLRYLQAMNKVIQSNDMPKSYSKDAMLLQVRNEDLVKELKDRNVNIDSILYKEYNKYKTGGEIKKYYDVFYSTKGGGSMVAKNIEASSEEEAKEKLTKQMRASSSFDKPISVIQKYAEGGEVYSDSKWLTKDQWEKWNEYVKTGKIEEKKEKNIFTVARWIGVSVANINAYEIEQRAKKNKYAEGGGIGFIPMDLEEKLMIIAKWGGISIKGVIGILNAMIDSGITDADLTPKPIKNTSFQRERATEKKIQDIWKEIEPKYNGTLKGNQYYSTIKQLVQYSNDDILKRYKPFRKYQYAEGGAIENENALMVANNNKQIAHHTEEMESALKDVDHVPAWVVAKVNRSASDLSDATHYLEGTENKYEVGGSVENSLEILKMETNSYSMEKYGEPIDEETFMVNGLKKDGEEIKFRFIVAESVSGKDITLTPAQLFDADRANKFEVGGSLEDYKKAESDYEKYGEYLEDAIEEENDSDIIKYHKLMEEAEIRMHRYERKYKEGGMIKGRGSRAKNAYNKEVDLYNWFIVDLDKKEAISGNEYKEDAIDALSDYDGDKNFKIVSKTQLKKLGIDDPTSEWKYAKGGWLTDHKYVNKSEDYEVRYSKGRKDRSGYKRFEEGGEIESKIEKLKVVANSKMLPESVKAKAKAEIEKLEKELHESKETKSEEKSEKKNLKIFIDNELKKLPNGFALGYSLREDFPVFYNRAENEGYSDAEVPFKEIEDKVKEYFNKGKLHESKETKSEEKSEHKAGGSESKKYKDSENWLTLQKLYIIEGKADDLIKYEGGGIENQPIDKIKKYVKYIYKEVSKLNTPFDSEIFNALEDENAHSLNLTLGLLGFYKNEKDSSEWARKRENYKKIIDVIDEIKSEDKEPKSEKKAEKVVKTKVAKSKVEEIRDKVYSFLTPLNFEAKIDDGTNEIIIEPNTRKVGEKRADYFDGMQIIYDVKSDIYEVSEYQAGKNNDELHIYKVTPSLIVALKDLIKGNKRKPIKVISDKVEEKPEPAKKEVKSKVVGDDLKVIKFFDLTESDWNKMALNERNKLSESYKEKTKKPTTKKVEVKKVSHKEVLAKVKAKKGKKEYSNAPSKGHKRNESSDRKREALPLGKRISESGNVYYENRLNRGDLDKGDKFKIGGEIMKKGKEISFEKSNLYLVGKGHDTNGNAVVKVKYPNSGTFSIQTLGNLPKTKSILNGVSNLAELTADDLERMEKEIVSYIESFGTATQKKGLKTYFAKGGEVESNPFKTKRGCW